MANPLKSQGLEQLFRSARSFNGWLPDTVSDDALRELYELLKWGPTSANCTPARFVWVRTVEGKTRLASMAAEMNRSNILAAPVTVVIGNDLDFSDTLSKLLRPDHADKMKQVFSDPALAEVTAMRNGSLQGAYLIIAARALGLDCGPMSGFDNGTVDKSFFEGTRIRSNFICSLGYGDPDSLHPRLPRLSFEEAGRFE